MDGMRERAADAERGPTGMLSDVKRLKTEASATTSELRDFIRGLKGRSPQEVMGIVAGNALTQAMVTSTIACVLLLAALSVPFAFGSSSKNKSKPKPAVAAEAEASKSEADTKTTANGDTPSEGDLKRASKAMGLDETKTANPNKNPLDNFDNLLDKVK